jgi:hypothetical protein
MKVPFFMNGDCYFNGDWGLGIGDWAQSPIPMPIIPSPFSLQTI